jgi:regulator of protease activity HflC (stomatin/prohibitin superfamily)
MPGWFIASLVFFVFALIAAAVTVFASADARGIGVIVTGVLAFVSLVFVIISCYDRVDTRNVGIITEFGRPVGIHGPGIAWHNPWRKLSELPETIQLQAFESNSYDDAAKGQGSDNNAAAISVRLANNSNAYVAENLNWRLREGAAPKLFQDYGGQNVFETIKQQLVDRQAQVALAKTFATFNPQIMLAAQANTPGAPPQAMAPTQGADLPTLAGQVKKDLQDAVGTEIEILDVRIPRIFYDQPTQQRIDAYNQKVQETLNAAQDVKTAEQYRLAAEQRAMQPPPDLRIAVSNCVNDSVKAGRDPAGCWGQIGGTPLIQIPR